MKKFTMMLIAAIVAIAAYAGGDDLEAEKKEIKNVIQTAYIDGLQNKGDLSLTEKGFHPGFNLLGIQNNTLTKFPIYSWIEYTEKKKIKDPSPPTKEDFVTCEFAFVDVTGSAAVAKIYFYKGEDHVYTDYLSLYKFEEGWRIVNKIYYKLPEEEK